MYIVLLLIAGAATGFALNRAAERRFDDEVAVVMGAGAVLLCYLGLLLLPLVFVLLKYALILAVIAGLAAAIYLIARKR